MEFTLEQKTQQKTQQKTKQNDNKHKAKAKQTKKPEHKSTEESTHIYESKRFEVTSEADLNDTLEAPTSASLVVFTEKRSEIVHGLSVARSSRSFRGSLDVFAATK